MTTSIVRDTRAQMAQPVVEGAYDAARVVRAHIERRNLSWHQENFGVILLDARGRPVVRGPGLPDGVIVVCVGTLTACLVHPREVFRPAIEFSTAQLICWHNHPSGDPAPSDEDRTLATRMTSAGDLLGIPVVDHIIVTPISARSYS